MKKENNASMDIFRKIKRFTHQSASLAKEDLDRFERDIEKYNSLLSADKRFLLDRKYCLPIYDDQEGAASVDAHYFLQDHYMAKKIIQSGIKEHFDIGSRIDGFIMHLLSADVSCNLLDIRPFPIQIEGLNFIQTDATNLSNIDDNSIDSISSLHAIEHFGLGRYGDSIDPYAWVKALNSISLKLKTGGYFYLGLPVGNRDVLHFNAHRVFKPTTIIESLPNLKIVSFAYIHEYRIRELDINNIASIDKQMGNYDCGLFVFTK